jgi:hypothetical protein
VNSQFLLWLFLKKRILINKIYDNNESLVVLRRSDDDCSSTEHVPKNDQCAYCKTHGSDQEGDGLVAYVYCPMFTNSVGWICFILLGVFIILYFVLMGDIANKNFVSSLLFVADTIGMSEHMVGLTFLSIGLILFIFFL